MAKNSGDWGRDKAKERYADGGSVSGETKETGRKVLGSMMNYDKSMKDAGWRRTLSDQDMGSAQTISDVVPRGRKK